MLSRMSFTCNSPLGPPDTSRFGPFQARPRRTGLTQVLHALTSACNRLLALLRHLLCKGPHLHRCFERAESPAADLMWVPFIPSWVA